MFNPSLLRTAFVVPAAAFMLVSGGEAHAQQAKPKPQWSKFCSKIGESDVCNVQFTVTSDNGRLVTSVNLLEAKGKQNRKLFQVAVPSGRFIPAGVSLKIDNGKENRMPYSLCLPDRCLAEVELSNALIKAFKGGGELTLTSVNFRNQKNPVKVTLSGFTKSFDGEPLKRNEMESRNKKLEAELQRKAKETADKLKAAQEAAKQSSN